MSLERTVPMVFSGWALEDFAVFEVAGFDERMALIRARIQPRLDVLGKDLSPLLEAETGTEWFYHVAKHMRRSVNPPGDTWVAFNRSGKGYKATVHFDVGISAAGANVSVVVKPECLERDVFAGGLVRNASALGRHFKTRDDVAIGDVPVGDWKLLSLASRAGPKVWKAEAETLRRVKSSEFEAGLRIAPAAAVALGGPGFVAAALDGMRALMPLYLGGVDRSYRLAPPAP
jgi:uncharacterized protein YktB (UPF0637 family)